MKQIKWAGLLLAILGTGFSISLCGIGIGTYLAGALLTLLLDRQYVWRPVPYRPLLAILLVSLAVSWVISPLPDVSARGYFKFLQGFILLYAGYDLIRSKKEAGMALLALVLVFLAAALDGISQQMTGKDLLFGRPYAEGRLSGPFKRPTDFAVFLSAGLGLIAGFVMEWCREWRWRLASGGTLLAALLGYMTLHTYSRGAVLSFGFAMIIVGAFFGLRIFTILIAVLGGIGFTLMPPGLMQRLLETFSVEHGSTSERILLVETTLKMIHSAPFFGLGLNTYSHFFPQFRPPDYQGLMYAHNGYLQIAAEAGLIGVGLFVAFIVMLVVRAVRAIIKPGGCHRAGLVGGLAAAMVLLGNAFFESLFQSTQLRTLFWVIMGVVLALSSMPGSSGQPGLTNRQKDMV